MAGGTTTPEQALKDWKAGKFGPVYYFVGEDGPARLKSAQDLKELLKPDPFNLNELDSERADEAVSAANTSPVFSDRRLVLLRGTRLSAEGKKELVEYLKDPLPSSTIVLHSDDPKPDMRDALVAAASRLGGLVVFQGLSEDEAAARLTAEAKRAGVELAHDAADFIVEEAGTHWGILRAELEKLILYGKGRAKLTREDALACLGYRQQANPFQLPQLVTGRKRVEALEMMGRLLEEGVSEFQILGGITREFNRLLRARRLRGAGAPEAQIFRELRLHPYYGQAFLRQAEAAAEPRLIKSLKLCLETEADLKSKSWLDPKIELERLVARLAQ